MQLHFNEPIDNSLGNCLRSRRTFQFFSRGIKMKPNGALTYPQDDAGLPRGLALGCPLQAVELPRRHKDLTFAIMPIYSKNMTMKIIGQDLALPHEEVLLFSPFGEPRLCGDSKNRGFAEPLTEREGQSARLLRTDPIVNRQ